MAVPTVKRTLILKTGSTESGAEGTSQTVPAIMPDPRITAAERRTAKSNLVSSMLALAALLMLLLLLAVQALEHSYYQDAILRPTVGASS